MTQLVCVVSELFHSLSLYNIHPSSCCVVMYTECSKMSILVISVRVTQCKAIVEVECACVCVGVTITHSIQRPLVWDA